MSLDIAREAPFNCVPQLTPSFDSLEDLKTVIDLPRKHLARKLSKRPEPLVHEPEELVNTVYGQ